MCILEAAGMIQVWVPTTHVGDPEFEVPGLGVAQPWLQQETQTEFGVPGLGVAQLWL